MRVEETEDSLRDRRMERGGVAGNVDYRRPAKNSATGSKEKYDGMSALEKGKSRTREEARQRVRNVIYRVYMRGYYAIIPSSTGSKSHSGFNRQDP